jgi:molybdate transport system ATP-binding protein
MIRARIRKNFPAREESAAYSLDVQFEAAKGITALFGPSGSGKTLTLDCIAGFARPTEGRIMVDDEILYDGKSGLFVRPQQRRCGYVFQNYALFPHMSLRENLLFGAAHLPAREGQRKVSELLEQFRLADVAGRRPYQVSGGQKQRCSIARALAGEPRLLLLDEAARGLDVSLRAELYQIIRSVRNDFAIPVLLVTHDMEECFELAEDMIVLRDGRVVQTGSPQKICEAPANLELARLLQSDNIVPVEIKTLDPSRNISVLKVGEFEITAAYLPGRLRGDRVHLLVRPNQLRAVPRNERLGANQIGVSLLRAVEGAGTVQLEFPQDLKVVISSAEYERYRGETEWAVEFPDQLNRVL